MRAATSGDGYVPALGFGWLTRFYDPLVRLTLREAEFKARLLAQARIRPGHDVLDLGCGTATLVIMCKRAHPGARVVGLDADPEILARGRAKAADAGIDVELREGLATEPPLPPASFDRVLSTLTLHHLTTDEKRRALASARQLLRPGGELHVADFGRPHNPLMWVLAHGVAWLDGAERLQANLDGALPRLMEDAGFADARETGRSATPFGTLALYRAVAPAIPPP